LPNQLAAPRWYSLVAIAAAAVTVAFLPLQGAEPQNTPVSPPRTVKGLSTPRDNGLGQVLHLSDPDAVPDERKLMLLMAIDGNRDGEPVLFNHAAHVERTGGESSCALCHHLNMPLDENTSCGECHRDMYEPTSLFDHASHVQKLGGNDGCSRCHTDYATVKSYETAKMCSECHEHPSIPQPIIQPPQDRWRSAPGYTDAMHGLCIKCHQNTDPKAYAAVLERCDNCHDTDRAAVLRRMMPGANK
jgi:hypothetical protein